MDFLAEQQIIFTSKKYEPIYKSLNTLIDVKYHDLFMLCASIGFKNNKKWSLWKKSLHNLKLQKSHLAAETSIEGYIER